MNMKNILPKRLKTHFQWAVVVLKVENILLFKAELKKYIQLDIFGNNFELIKPIILQFFLQNMKKQDVPNLA